MSDEQKMSWKQWAKAAGIRAIRTFAQTLLLVQFVAEHFDEFLAVARLRRTIFADGTCL